MTIVLSDIKDLFDKLPEDTKLLCPTDTDILPCRGCFACWIKTPGECAFKDGFENTGKLLGQANKIFIVSRVTFGSLSPFIKNVLDRSISYVHPLFRFRNGKMRHRMRYHLHPEIYAYLYSDPEHDGYTASEDEYSTVLSLLSANAENLGGKFIGAEFFSSPQKLHSINI